MGTCESDNRVCATNFSNLQTTVVASYTSDSSLTNSRQIVLYDAPCEGLRSVDRSSPIVDQIFAPHSHPIKYLPHTHTRKWAHAHAGINLN